MNIPEDLIKAHKYSSHNMASLKKDELCGCFYCLKIFNPNEITDWTDEESGGTAICPYCEIDSIIGKYSGYPITEEFLELMHKSVISAPLNHRTAPANHRSATMPHPAH